MYIEKIASVGSSCWPLELGCPQEPSLAGCIDRSIAAASDYAVLVLVVFRIAASEAGS